MVGCGWLFLTLSSSRTIEIKLRHNNSRRVRENDKEQATQNVRVDAGTEFKGSFSGLCDKYEIECYQNFSNKRNGICRKKHAIAQEFDIFRTEMYILKY